ncbi:MAG: nucleoside hydrolase [Erysipelotrichaceae bacterium]|nr:nucleoside hydrolase [Erysipelotrichaceae bacterium]
MSERRPVWIDTDTGVDDAFALVTALKLPNIDVVGVSAVAGNVELEKTFRNARNVLSLCGREDIRVYKGAERPLIVPLHTAYNVHGKDGLGGVVIPDSKAPVEEESAVDALYRKAKELNGELCIAAVGPLTNIAIAIFKYPDIVRYIKELAVMGGSVAVGGNTTVAAEFNIYGDPHAAQAVFKSGIPITMFGLDVTMKTVLTREEVDTLKDQKNDVAEFCYAASNAPMSLYKMLGLGDVMCMHDTCPLVYLNDQSLFKGKQAGVYVETQSEISLGRTVSDIFVHADKLFDKKNVMVMLEVDRDRVADLVLDTFKAYQEEL